MTASDCAAPSNAYRTVCWFLDAALPYPHLHSVIQVSLPTYSDVCVPVLSSMTEHPVHRLAADFTGVSRAATPSGTLCKTCAAGVQIG